MHAPRGYPEGMLSLVSLALATSTPAPARQEQVYADLFVVWRPRTEHPFGLGLAGSWRTAPGFEEAWAPELGGFVRADWVFGEGIGAAAGFVGGVAALDRAPVRYVPVAQLDVTLGVAWESGFGAWAGGGAARALDFVGASCGGCGDGPADVFSLRVDGGATWIPGAGLRGRLMPGVQAAMAGREYPL